MVNSSVRKHLFVIVMQMLPKNGEKYIVTVGTRDSSLGLTSPVDVSSGGFLGDANFAAKSDTDDTSNVKADVEGDVPAATVSADVHAELQAQNALLRARLAQVESGTHFIDDMVERALTAGVFTAVLKGTVEETLRDQIEEHVAEASDAAAASKVRHAAFDRDYICVRVGRVHVHTHIPCLLT